MTEVCRMSFQRQSCAFADFLPNVLWSRALLRKNRAAGVSLRLKTEHPPDLRALGIGQIPTNDLGHIVDVFFRNGETERVFERGAGFLANAAGKLGKSFAHGVQIAFALHPLNWITMPSRL